MVLKLNKTSIILGIICFSIISSMLLLIIPSKPSDGTGPQDDIIVEYMNAQEANSIIEYAWDDLPGGEAGFYPHLEPLLEPYVQSYGWGRYKYGYGSEAVTERIHAMLGVEFQLGDMIIFMNANYSGPIGFCTGFVLYYEIHEKVGYQVIFGFDAILLDLDALESSNIDFIKV